MINFNSVKLNQITNGRKLKFLNGSIKFKVWHFLIQVKSTKLKKKLSIFYV